MRENKFIDGFRITKIYKHSLFISVILFLVSVILIFSLGLDYDLIFTGGTSLEYRVSDEDFNILHEKVLNLNFDEIQAKKTVLNNENILSINIENSMVDSNFIETLFGESDYTLIKEEVFTKNIGKQISIKIFIILVAFTIIVLIVCGIAYRDIGGFKTGLCLIITLLFNIFTSLGLFSLFKIKIGSTIFVFATLSVIITCYNFIVIFTKLKELETSTPTGKMTAKSLIDKGVSASLTTMLTALLSLLVIITLTFFIVTNLVKFKVQYLMSPTVIALILAHLTSIFLSPSLWYLFNKDGTF